MIKGGNNCGGERKRGNQWTTVSRQPNTLPAELPTKAGLYVQTAASDFKIAGRRASPLTFSLIR